MTFAFLSLLLAAEFTNTVEHHGSASINWTQMRLEGTANVVQNGPIDDYAKQEARALSLAHQALQETFETFEVTPNLNLDQITAQSSNSQRYIMANAKKYKVSHTSYQESGGVSVNVYWDIQALLRPIILEYSSEEIRASKPITHTGIIIDARSLNFDAVLFPEITKGTDEVWLSVKGFSRDRAETKLPFIYAPHAAHSEVIERVGDKPAVYIAKSIRNHRIIIEDSFPTGLTESDAKAIMSTGNIAILLSK